MADYDITIVRQSTLPLAALERPCAPLVRTKRRQVYKIQLDAPAATASSTPMPPDLHFIYAPIWKNGTLVAKRTLQATDEYWSCLVDRSA